MAETKTKKETLEDEEVKLKGKRNPVEDDDEVKGHVDDSDDDSDDMIGPQPASDQPPTKKRKVLPHEDIYLENLPCADYYERSFMHRDVVTHLAVTKTDFIITASCDGHVKFWKKVEALTNTSDSTRCGGGIEFVKHFRSHLGNIQAISVNSLGTLLCTVSNDKSVKIFDIVNFDMINMLKLDFIPETCDWIHSSGDPIQALAIAAVDSPKLYIFDAQQEEATPIKVLDSIHRNPVNLIKYNAPFDCVLSCDTGGMIEYWSGSKKEYEFPSNVDFDSKLDTDLFEFVRNKVHILSLAVSPNGLYFACLASNRKVCVFRFLTASILLVLDESLATSQALQQTKNLIPNMEYGRRMAVERDLEKSEMLKMSTMTFDESSNFLLYPTVLGVKVVNIVTKRMTGLIGKPENMRILQIALFQGKLNKNMKGAGTGGGGNAAPTIELEAADNPTIDSILADPTLFCTAYKKNRFYLFSRRDPSASGADDVDRDVFNEKPSKEDIISATDATVGQRLYETAVIHTTKGDIHIKMFVKETPKSVENFCVHAKNGYFNGHVFHRVIKGFMIQTGDPTGVGTGGESIWGGEFGDEFAHNLRHDRPYTVSMANAGPNTNGSQFFITVIPTPWLDNKHTIFARVIRGMESVQNISMVKTNPKTDKPYDDVSIINITLK